MDPKWRHPYGIRPTLRQLMLLVLTVALISALARGMGGFSAGSSLFALSPVVLALMVLILDRPGPVKHWLFGFLFLIGLPTCVVWIDGMAVVTGLVPGNREITIGLVFLNLMALVWIYRVFQLLPRLCPRCGLRSWLRFGRRSSGMHWCASCGHKQDFGIRRHHRS